LNDPFTHVRLPWPDELPRLVAAFPKFPRQKAFSPLVLVAKAGEVERLVGLAGIMNQIKGVAGLALALQPRYLNDPGAGALLAAVQQTAAAAGARRLITIDDLRTGNPLVPMLEDNGFTIFRRLEFWMTALTVIRDRVERVQNRLVATGRAGRFTAEPLREDHLPAVEELMAAEHLLEARSITLSRTESGDGYDPKLSFVVFAGSRLAGALLAHRAGAEEVAVEAEAVALPWRGGTGQVHHTLYQACIQAASDLNLKNFIYTVDKTGHVDTGRMARRSDSRLLGEGLQLSKAMGSVA